MNEIIVTDAQQNKAEVIPAAGQFNEMLLTRFLEYADVAPKSIETYRKALNQFFKYLTEQGIQNPQRSDILNYKEHLAEDHKATTIQNYIAAVKIFFSWTEVENIYPDIARHIKGVKISREHKKDHLTSKQIKTVLNGIDTDKLTGLRDYAIITLMTTGGLRTIEVSRANIEDLRTLGDETVLYIQGKGRTEKADYIKISPQAEKAIREYLKERGTAAGNEPLFTSTSNNSRGNRLSTRTISGIAKKQMQAAGYDSDRLTAHSLRHTAVTLAITGGQKLAEVQEFARHADLNTTMVYNHAIDKAKNTCSYTVSNAIFGTGTEDAAEKEKQENLKKLGEHLTAEQIKQIMKDYNIA